MIQNNYYNNRVFHIWLLIIAAVAVIIIRLVDIQLVKNKSYLQISEKNRTQIIYQAAPRGRILTADGVPVADNIPSYTLIYVPVNKDESFIKSLVSKFAVKLKIKEDELFEIISKASQRGRSVRLADNLSVEDMLYFSELKSLYPGTELIMESRRYYPKGAFMTHLLGYIGKITQQQWQQKAADWKYRLSSYIGKTGIELSYEDVLRGRDGGIYMEIDYRGRVKNRLQQEEWQAGKNIMLTLDSQAQKAAETNLAKSLSGEGAIVAINPQTGAVLAMASIPTFNPNIFVDSSLKVDEALPEFDLTVKGQYPMASVFKIIAGAAILEEGGVNPEEKVMCKGIYDTDERQFKCWEKSGHGELNFYQAMAHSCDVYYYQMGLRVGPSKIEKYEKLFRLGVPSGIDIPGEKAGNIFGPNARAQRRGYWFIGDTLNLSIGQGELLATPMQAVQMIASIANGGDFWKPYYVDEISQGGKTLDKSEPILLSQLGLTQKTIKALRRSLKSAIDKGTGRGARSEEIEIYGKTGTAQNAHGTEHGWFVAYGNKQGKEPEIAIAVLVVHGKSGASVANIGRDVIEAYYRAGKYSPEYQAKLPVESEEIYISTQTITNVSEIME